MSGDYSTSYWLTTSTSVIVKNEKGFNPSVITVNGKSKEGKKEITDCNGRFIIYEYTNGNWVQKYSSSKDESSCNYTLSNPESIKVLFYKENILIDEEIIPVLLDGEKAPIGSLDNDSHVIPCNSNGTPLNYTGATTTMSVFLGGADDSKNWTYEVKENNVTGSITNNNRTYTFINQR